MHNGLIQTELYSYGMTMKTVREAHIFHSMYYTDGMYLYIGYFFQHILIEHTHRIYISDCDHNSL